MTEKYWEIFPLEPNEFLSRFFTMEVNCLYHYEPETKQQSVEWRHSVSPSPKIFRVKNSLENFSRRFFGIKTASSSLIIFQRAKLSKRSINNFWWCNWRTFWRETSAGNSWRVSWPCTTMPRLIALALASQKNLAYLGFQYLDHPPYSPDLGPTDYHLFLDWKKKTIGSSTFFFRRRGHCRLWDLYGRTTNLISFLVASKS